MTELLAKNNIEEKKRSSKKKRKHSRTKLASKSLSTTGTDNNNKDKSEQRAKVILSMRQRKNMRRDINSAIRLPVIKRLAKKNGIQYLSKKSYDKILDETEKYIKKLISDSTKVIDYKKQRTLTEETLKFVATDIKIFGQ